MTHPGKMALTTPKSTSGKRIDTWRQWLPTIWAEVLLFAPLLLWLLQHHSKDPGLTMIYAWIVYGLIALSFLFFWIGLATEQEPTHKTDDP